MSFRVQLAIVLGACLAMAALAFILISDAVRSAEDRLVREASQQVAAALAELVAQYRDQESFRAEDLDTLPGAAIDVSLKGIAVTVLRSYDQVAGGFATHTALEGVSGELNPADEPRVRRVASDALSKSVAPHALLDGDDVLIIAAQPVKAGQRTAWTLRKLIGIRNPVSRARRFWIAGLVISALLGTGGIVAIWYVYRSSASALSEGLKRMEADVNHRLPPIGGDFGRIASAINRMADRRRQLEESIRHQDRLAALGKVVAGVAHEIRNPLNSAILTLELLGARVSSAQASESEAKAAIAEIRRLDDIVTRYLVFGKPSLPERRDQEVAPLIERAIDIVRGQARQKNIRIVTKLEDSARAPVDASQIEQVLVNLILNAIEAAPDDSEVGVTMERAAPDVRIHVDDRGSGIDPAVAVHVFDAYFTTKGDGSGLGLAVSREIVEIHGGQLWFESHAGKGTRFTLRLPCGAEA
jgi:signal transduction histidine kinase